ncbi:MAG: DNA repair exonuclease [Oscillibacter sp.]|jgi:exonuclease SbcD|nr:DNA repair exonuclease [uncultured Oscillibacter sp.]MCI9643855.1 DNA repair exonuclease [Oscillibacter sp.]
MLKFIHAADFHLDSAFAALSAGRAAERRRESRELPFRLADYVNAHGVQLVLLAGDLFDSAAPYRETGEALAEALGRMKAQVFAAPGNHDWYGPGSPWVTVDWPENVHVFRESAMASVDLPDLGAAVHGAAFTSPDQGTSLLAGFSAPEDGRIHLGLLHGETGPAEARYNPLRREEVSASGLDYLALGHIHKRGEPRTYGRTLCAWPGCLEGRGFDELGEKGFYEGTIGGGNVSLSFVPFAGRRYEVLEVDVTGKPSPRAAVEAALPGDTANNLYRILLTGEAGEGGGDAKALETALAGRFYALEVRDHTRVAADIWARAGEDSLRGLFLRELRARWDAAGDEAEREAVVQAVRFGLAALDHRDLG